MKVSTLAALDRIEQKAHEMIEDIPSIEEESLRQLELYWREAVISDDLENLNATTLEGRLRRLELGLERAELRTEIQALEVEIHHKLEAEFLALVQGIQHSLGVTTAHVSELIEQIGWLTERAKASHEDDLTLADVVLDTQKRLEALEQARSGMQTLWGLKKAVLN